MLLRSGIITAGVLLTYAGVALGAVSAEKAAQLGRTLTMLGAEKAGNKEGTIPEYTGGLTTPPASYKKGSGWRPDPFTGEKPQYSISARNMASYADKLTEGTKAIMKKYPSYRIDVYKTHRTAALPKYILDNTVKAATTAKTANGGLSFTGAHAATPFPIPQDGYEAMWNHLLRYAGIASENFDNVYTVDSSGRISMQSIGDLTLEAPFYDPAKPDAKDYFYAKMYMLGPARRVGEANMLKDPIDAFHEKRKAWQYLPGQRRVKMAPDLSFDTPCAIFGGAITWDDIELFSGSMERWNMKLVGKKELYVPYNDYKLIYETNHEKDLLKPNHLNPDLVRWELHRVWVVEATLKPGKRHLYSKRVFYLDEDSWVAIMSDQYDGRGQLYRAGMSHLTPSYDALVPMGENFLFYDLVAGSYMVSNLPSLGKPGIKYFSHPLPEKHWTPDSMSGSGVR